MDKNKFNQAFLKEDPLSVSLTTKFKATEGGVVVDTAISFVLDHIKDSASRRINEQDEYHFEQKTASDAEALESFQKEHGLPITQMIS